LRKHLSFLALTAGLALAFTAVPASAAEPVEINFVASGPVLGVSPEGYDGPIEDNPINGEMVKLQYQKKRADGSWATKKTQNAEIQETIVYGGPTPTFARGKCRIVAKYAGNETYAAAKKANRYTCKTGMLIYS
jgi:hypothetical protein